MTDRDIVKKLQILRTAGPDKNWSSSARANILAYARNSAQQSSAAKSFSTFFFTPNRAFVAVAGFAAIFVVAIVLGFMPKVANEVGQQALITDVDITDVDSESEKEIVVYSSQTQISEKHVAANAQFSAEIKQVKNEAASQSQTLGSARVDEEDPYLVFKTFVRARLNRLWVLAQDSKNEPALSVAEEAEDLYKTGDYDGALRGVSAAEDMLK